jgi:hypothetical protein
MKQKFRRKGFYATLLSLFLGWMTGCAGNVRSTFVSQNMNAISVDPPDTRSAQLNANQCYWWIDEKGQLNIAARDEQKSIFGRQFDREFAICFVPGQPSNGVGKDYRITHGRIKGYLRFGTALHRFESTYGLIGIENRPKDILIASFRSGLQIQSSKLLGGWSNGILFYCFGTLEAHPSGSEHHGEQIKDQVVHFFDE